GPLLWLFSFGVPEGGLQTRPYSSPFASEDANSTFVTPSLPHPLSLSSHTVLTLTYGSGTDLHRPEFAQAADLLTTPVDGRRLLSGWSDLRTQFWGFGE